MRTAMIAGSVLLMLAVPVHAQFGKRHGGGDAPKSDKKPGVDEKAYKAALKRIPDSTEKVDPWGQMRPTDPHKK